MLVFILYKTMQGDSLDLEILMESSVQEEASSASLSHQRGVHSCKDCATEVESAAYSP